MRARSPQLTKRLFRLFLVLKKFIASYLIRLMDSIETNFVFFFAPAASNPSCTSKHMARRVREKERGERCTRIMCRTLLSAVGPNETMEQLTFITNNISTPLLLVIKIEDRNTSGDSYLMVSEVRLKNIFDRNFHDYIF